MMLSVVIHSATGIPIRSRKGATIEAEPGYSIFGHAPWKSDGSIAAGYEVVEAEIDFVPRPGAHRWNGSAFRDATARERQEYREAVAEHQAGSSFDRPDEDTVLLLKSLLDVLQADHGINVDRSRVRARYIQRKKQATQ